MRVLGIETSCDETSAAIVEERDDDLRPWLVRSNVVASQVDIHRAWGGIVPELSARQHIRDICGVVERALEDAGPVAAGTGISPPSRTSDSIWPARWCTGTNGTLRDHASDLANDRPTRSEPTRPGPCVTAIRS